MAAMPIVDSHDRARRRALGELQADVVHLHDEGDHAVDGHGDQEPDEREDDAPRDDRLVEHLLERDHHDLRRQDEVGSDRPGHGLRLGLRSLERGRHLVTVVVVAQRVDDLVGALVGEEAAAEHEDDLDDLRRDRAEQQRHREDDEDLVAQRSEGDLLDDRQLALRREPTDVGRRDRGVVDHDARRLHARPARGEGHVVDGGRGQLGQRRHVIEQSDQTASHPSSSCSVGFRCTAT
jgi:hypothetical protein